MARHSKASDRGCTGEVYDELHFPKIGTGGPIVFPDKCPVCGADKQASQNDGAPWASVQYDCGGGYSTKPQIQNHTDVFWGRCGKS